MIVSFNQCIVINTVRLSSFATTKISLNDVTNVNEKILVRGEKFYQERLWSCGLVT